jgi:hypothetical protein
MAFLPNEANLGDAAGSSRHETDVARRQALPARVFRKWLSHFGKCWAKVCDGWRAQPCAGWILPLFNSSFRLLPARMS